VRAVSAVDRPASWTDVFARPSPVDPAPVIPIERFELDDGRVLTARLDEDDRALVLPFTPGGAYESYARAGWSRARRSRTRSPAKARPYAAIGTNTSSTRNALKAGIDTT
jgi:hypothetical protein